MRSSALALLLLALAPLTAIPAYAADGAPGRTAGPVFEAWGPVFDVQADYLPPAEAYRVLFDVWLGPEAPDRINPRLVTLARFMNMHARQGIAVEDMHLAVVLHGSAGRAVLRNADYRARFGVDNPDLPLLQALAAEGVRMLICGQSAAARGYEAEAMIEPVRIAPSAYTALMGLQAEGYRLMPTWR